MMKGLKDQKLPQVVPNFPQNSPKFFHVTVVQFDFSFLFWQYKLQLLLYFESELQNLEHVCQLLTTRYCYNATIPPSMHHTCIQSHYREVPRWEIFIEQELRFGLDLGRMANFPAFIASKSFDL